MPDGFVPPEPCSVVLLGREDELEDTVKPRLRAAGADESRIHRLQAAIDETGVERPITFPRDCELLRETLRETEARLVVVDPFTAFLDDTVSSLNEQMARRALEPLARIAREMRAVVALVRHLVKGARGLSALHSGGGAVGIMGMARTAFLVGEDASGVRLLAASKNNLGPPAPTLAYGVRLNAEGLPVLEWVGTSPVTADEVVLTNGSRFGASVARAEIFLQQALHAATRRQDVVREEAAALGISRRTLERAKQRLQIRTREVREGGRNVWYWSLPGEEAVRAEQAQLMAEIWAAGENRCA
jgi:hypothetical protein